MATTQYIPGVCNIGPAEIRNRRNTGLISAAIGVALLVILIVTGAPPLTRAIVFVPFAIGASALIQARLHFCAGFGAAGLFNFSNEVGKTDSVSQADYRAKDKKKAIQITVAAAIIGLVIAILAVVI
jgi:hypothetical protein